MTSGPLSRYRHQQITTRQLDELLGICRGVVMDGHVSQNEAELLMLWMANNRQCLDTWPGSVLYTRISAMLRDGTLDQEEQRDLLELLRRTTGGLPSELGEGNAATDLPLDDPFPRIDFPGRAFCLTGTFHSGPRHLIKQVIENKGGTVLDSVTKKLDFLVIGSLCTASWKHSAFGTKILKAVDIRASGGKLAIVSEEHWRTVVEP